jgi:HNH endonuclease
MHHAVINYGDRFPDHINGDRLDNRRENLRLVTKRQNNFNKKVRSDSLTGIKGITRCGNRWQALISSDGVKRYLGSFPTPYDAAVAYNQAALLYHGDYARLNDLGVIAKVPEFNTAIPRRQPERPSPYPNVHWEQRTKSWRASAVRTGRTLHAGRFKDLQEAVGAAESIDEFLP